MRRRIFLFICCFVFLIMSTVSAENLGVLNTNGSIMAADEDRVVVQGTGSMDNVAVWLLGKTYILDNATRQEINSTDLKPGDYVYTFYGANMTKSIPAQAKAILLVRGKSENGIAYMGVSQVEDMGDYVKVYYNNQSMDINEQAMKSYKSIRQGDEILVWYVPLVTPIPTTYKASHAVLLNRTVQENVDINVVQGIIWLNNKVLLSSEQHSVYSVDGMTYVPLRAVTDVLGYSLTWNAAQKNISMQKGSKQITLKVGSRAYWNDKKRVVLEPVPYIVEGKTIVPLEFFSDVMDEQVQVK